MRLYRPTHAGPYFGDYTDPSTGRRIRRSLKTGDKVLANRILNKLQEEAIKASEGFTDPFKQHTDRPLSEHLDDWKQVLSARDTARHVTETIRYVREVLAGCRITLWRNLTHTRVEMWLSAPEQQETSTSGRNRRLRSIKSFCAWMVKGGRVAANPLVRLEHDLAGERAERTKFRCALDDDEIRRLLDTTEPDRSMLYRAGLETGFRAGELRSLTVGSLNVDDSTITVAAAYSKHRRRDVQPITPGFACDLAEHLAGRQATEPIFPNMPRPAALAIVLRRDAVAACVSTDGLDFHSLRHSFVSRLARANVHPRTAQDLARHADARLTMSVYTHVGRGQLSDALNTLTDIGAKKKTRAVA